MARLTILALLALCWAAQPAAAQAGLQGFALEKYDAETRKFSPHVRLIFSDKLSEKLEGKVVISPVGPMPLWSYYSLIWRKPSRTIDAIEAGRQFPPFGREWFYYRVDEVPALNYSAAYAPLVAIDTGVSVSGHSGKLTWYSGAFIGDRVFGNAPAWKGGPDFYLRGEYALSPLLSLGTSQRIGLVPASGADLLLAKGRARLTLEGVDSQGLAQAYAQVEYRLNKKLSLAGRHEWLAGGNRWGGALTFALSKGYEIKVLRETNPNQLLVQGAVKF